MGNIKKIDKVSYYQVVLLILVSRLTAGLTDLPILIIPPANQDMWIAGLLSILYAIIFYLPLLYLSNKFNDLNLIEYGKVIMGKIFGNIVGVFYFVLLFSIVLLLMSIFVEILDATLFPETPTWVTASIISITCILLSYQGFRNIVRLGEVVIPFALIMIFLLIILGYGNYDFSELLPILRDSTFKEINIAAMNVGIRFLDIVILTMITPHLEKKEDINKIFFRTIIFATVAVTLILVVVQTSLGIEFAKHINLPFFTFARLINLGQIIQGFDALYIVSWIMGNAIKISAYLYLTTVALGEITNRKNSYFIIPISIAILILVVLIKDNFPVSPLEEPVRTILLVAAIISVLIIPLIMLIVYFFRRKKL